METLWGPSGEPTVDSTLNLGVEVDVQEDPEEPQTEEEEARRTARRGRLAPGLDACLPGDIVVSAGAGGGGSHSARGLPR